VSDAPGRVVEEGEMPRELIMNEQVITGLALVAAAICSACVLLMLPAIARAAIRGNVMKALRAAGLGAVLTLLAFSAFAMVGADAAGYLGRM
jgi:hypothetical protein